ncbi:MAG: hypothetical protein K1X26_11940 [Chitinophagales bacterium]|nr:hypothetical protein [Chitinophagales bacterium]
MCLGRAYLFSNNLKTAEIFLQKAVNNSEEGIYYGNLAHLYLAKNDEKKSFEYYNRCIRLLKDEKDFLKRCNLDLKFIIKLGISEQKYIEMRDNVITNFLKNK